MTRKEFRGYTKEEAIKKASGVKGITDIQWFDKLGVWKVTVINYK